ncbi:MAG: IS3 family transposase [Sarcina sp.]
MIPRNYRKEKVYRTTYKNFKKAEMTIFPYIEGWYNSKKLHSGFDYKTPNEVESLAKNVA